ncbi:hypothetical protein BN938_1064 [Mucinivorans hirudinis]|uniref:Uncharacterized protein n=1 Tax=Mucinivorans hirudinis TaxID=1433126 RepID=A0A060R7F6_9BACT|nr:hypothetical protein BN938_1064 [Mucinivorans hirudinis]
MSQQEYDAFREQMKQWMFDNSDIYDEFEEMMNSQSDMGVQQIMAQAMTLIPEYGKLISKKINSGNADDVAEVEAAFEKANLAEELVNQFGKASTVPAMICWLFFGRSFETMVENLERIVKDPTQNQSDKLFATQAIKLVIEQSIISGIRTAEDWGKYGNLRNITNNNNALEWALSNLEESDEELTPLNRPEQVSVLDGMILLDGEKKKMLLDKIGEYINTGVKGKRVAFMILALRGLGYLPEITSDRQLFMALKTHFNTYIGSDKSIYAYLENGISTQFKSEIDNLTVYFKVD